MSPNKYLHFTTGWLTFRHLCIVVQMLLLIAAYTLFALSLIEMQIWKLMSLGILGIAILTQGIPWVPSNLFLLMAAPLAWSMRLSKRRWWSAIVVFFASLSLLNVLRAYAYVDRPFESATHHWVLAHVCVLAAFIIPVWKYPQRPLGIRISVPIPSFRDVIRSFFVGPPKVPYAKITQQLPGLDALGNQPLEADDAVQRENKIAAALTNMSESQPPP